MSDRVLRQIITEAVQATLIGQTVVSVEVTLPNRFMVTFGNGLTVSTIFENVVALPNKKG